MEKKLLVFFGLLHIGVIYSAENAPTSPSDFITTTQNLEKKKAELVLKITQNNAHIESLRASHPPIYSGANSPEAFLLLFVAIANIAALKEAEKLQKEQVKNKLELTELDTSLEATYFKQLNPSWKKKLLLSKIEANKTESEKLSNELPALFKKAQQKPFYLKLGILNAAALIGALKFMGTTNSQPNVRHLQNISTGISCAFLLSLMFPIMKWAIAADAHIKFKNTMKKILELETKRPNLSNQIESLANQEVTPVSPEQQKQQSEDLAVTPSNELFQKIYDEAHSEQLDTAGKRKKLLSKIEATTSESTTLVKEASALEKIVEKKPFYSRLFKIAGVNIIGAVTLPLAFIKPHHRENNPYLATYILASTLSALGLMIKHTSLEEADKKLQEIKGKLSVLKEKTTQHTTDLTQLSIATTGN